MKDTTNQTKAESVHQAMLDNLKKADRERVVAADRAAHALSKRLAELTPPGDSGEKPIHTVSDKELYAIVEDAEAMVKDLPSRVHVVLTAEIWNTYYAAKDTASEELGRRSKERQDAAAALDKQCAEFRGVLLAIGGGADGFNAAMAALPVAELLGAALECTERSADEISAMTDRELADAIATASSQANASSVSVAAGEQVAQIAKSLPSVAKAMQQRRASDLDAKSRAEVVRAQLDAERERRSVQE